MIARLKLAGIFLQGDGLLLFCPEVGVAVVVAVIAIAAHDIFEASRLLPAEIPGMWRWILGFFSSNPTVRST